MIEFYDFVTPSSDNFEVVLMGMRNPKNSWEKSDSHYDRTQEKYVIGENDMRLASQLISFGTEHRKFLRQLPVVFTINAPLYWWKQMSTYGVGTTTDSCSTMHKLLDEKFTLEDFSCEYLDVDILAPIVDKLNEYREAWLAEKDAGKRYVLWHKAVELLPESFNQIRTWSANYEVLLNILRQRKGHKLSEWAEFSQYCLDNVPYLKEFMEAI